MLGHSDLRVALQRFSPAAFALFRDHLARLDQLASLREAAYVSLLDAVWKSFGLFPRELKMPFRGFPLTRRSRGGTGYRLRKPGGSPKRNRSGVDQLTSERVKLRSLRLLAEQDKTLNHKHEHKPRTECVRLADTRQERAFIIKQGECAFAIACIGHHSKKRSFC